MAESSAQKPQSAAGCPGEISPESSTPTWDGYPPNPERPGYHWLRRTDAVSPMPPVIWTWRPEVQAWRWKGEEQRSPAEQAATKEYIAPVTPHDEVERLRVEVASLRLTLGGRTFDATVPEPIGCPLPGACATVAEISHLRGTLNCIIHEEDNAKPSWENCVRMAREALAHGR